MNYYLVEILICQKDESGGGFSQQFYRLVKASNGAFAKTSCERWLAKEYPFQTVEYVIVHETIY